MIPVLVLNRLRAQADVPTPHLERIGAPLADLISLELQGLIAHTGDARSPYSWVWSITDKGANALQKGLTPWNDEPAASAEPHPRHPNCRCAGTEHHLPPTTAELLAEIHAGNLSRFYDWAEEAQADNDAFVELPGSVLLALLVRCKQVGEPGEVAP